MLVSLAANCRPFGLLEADTDTCAFFAEMSVPYGMEDKGVQRRKTDQSTRFSNKKKASTHSNMDDIVHTASRAYRDVCVLREAPPRGRLALVIPPHSGSRRCPCEAPRPGPSAVCLTNHCSRSEYLEVVGSAYRRRLHRWSRRRPGPLRCCHHCAHPPTTAPRPPASPRAITTSV